MEQDFKLEKNPSIITVVIPAYKVSEQILPLLNKIGPEVNYVLVVDDACPEGSGRKVVAENLDQRVEVIFNSHNLGVGGSVITGYRRALQLDSDIIVKIDGDGQMDPTYIHQIVEPIITESAGYSKGNRFFDVESILQMPKVRIIGNLVLSFLTKLSTGYWKLFDPNNGYTAISAKVLKDIPLNKIDNRYFFESDMLFRLSLAKIKVVDVSIPSLYGNEKSNLSLKKSVFEFSYKHFKNFIKRIVYSYYIRDFTLASLELPLGLVLTVFGLFVGSYSWIINYFNGVQTQPGTLILVAISLICGIQLLLSFLNFDIQNSN
jgi:GT2 family glycosyltransferase